MNTQLNLLNKGLGRTIAALKKRELSLMTELAPYTITALNKGLKLVKETINLWETIKKQPDISVGGNEDTDSIIQDVVDFLDPEGKASRKDKERKRKVRKLKGERVGPDRGERVSDPSLGPKKKGNLKEGPEIGANEKVNELLNIGKSINNLIELELSGDAVPGENVEVGAYG